MELEDMPFMPILANFFWGSNISEDVSPEICLESFPALTSPCISGVLVKLLGIIIMMGACLNKLPLYINVLKTGSVAGMSPGAVYGETIMYANAAFYGLLRGNPFTAWGENGIMTLQAIGICFLLWKYKDEPKVDQNERLIAAAGFGAYVFVVTVILPPEHYYLLQASNWPVLLYSRGGALAEIWRIQHTGTQSIITNIMNLGGSCIRILTTIKEVGWDMALISGYALSAGLNVCLVASFFIFRKNTDKFLKSLAAKKKE
mmetsp:Transcript_37946/g.113364  ORF Transcript_37946/g.113364 Transcript_37946/m.113364 type:complete len:260 (-) Transcript_37946:168-947(-)